MILHILSQIFSHSLGKSGNKHLVVFLSSFFVDFGNQVIDLTSTGRTSTLGSKVRWDG